MYYNNKDMYINSIFKILGLFEDMMSDDSEITEKEYLSDLRRLYVRYLGKGNAEVYNTIKGLQKLGKNAGHDLVRQTVFHLISLG